MCHEEESVERPRRKVGGEESGRRLLGRLNNKPAHDREAGGSAPSQEQVAEFGNYC